MPDRTDLALARLRADPLLRRAKVETLVAVVPALIACAEALAAMPCEWAVECGRREEMRGEPPSPCARCAALARLAEAVLRDADAAP